MERGVNGDQRDSDSRGGHGAGIVGAIALAAAVGLGVGLLAAPQAGARTRRQLRRRFAARGHDEGHSSGLARFVTFTAGLAATYFLTSDEAAPGRARASKAATDLRQRAIDRWDRFQERRHANGGAAESSAQPEG